MTPRPIQSALIATTLLLTATAAAARAQTLTLKPDASAAALLCGPVEVPSTPGGTDPAEAQRLANAATQALILGDLSVASEFLDRALAVDPAAAEAVYLRGRVAADAESATAAIPWFCRYLALAPRGPSADEARRRLGQALEAGAGRRLLGAFAGGVARFQADELVRAEELFTAVLDESPVPEAYYNRALVRLSMDREAGARDDLLRYLELRPAAPDRATIEEALASIAAENPVRGAVPTFLLGAVFPGGGQYYTGRPGWGVLVTGTVAGAVATGYLYERTTVLCRSPAESGECPPDEIAGTETERPLLIPALGAAGGLMLISAIEAALHAGSTPSLSVSLGERSMNLELAPRATVREGALNVHWIRLSH